MNALAEVAHGLGLARHGDAREVVERSDVRAASGPAASSFDRYVGDPS